MERITSKTNKIIKDTKKLITSSSARRANGLFVLEGARLCFDVLNSVYKVQTLFVTEKLMGKYPDEVAALAEKSEKSFIITEEIADKLADTDSPQGIFAVCDMAESTAPIGKKAVALDNVQTPSNVGAIIRTAEALGIDSIIIGGGCDIYNPKVLRASMGSVLRMNIIMCDDLAEALCNLKPYYQTFATVPRSSATPITKIDFTNPTVCVIGNEANGVSAEVLDVADGQITIPMKGKAESLNASVAASVTMWEMMRCD